MSSDHVLLRPGAYADSVTLLQVSRTVQGSAGVVTAQVAMATPLNVDVLAGMGFDVPAEATTNDLVVALRLESPEGLDAALAAVDAALTSRRTSSGDAARAPHRTTRAALREEPGLALVSVPGTSAAVEAMDALESDCDVMIFSDNVPVAQEVALKRFAADRSLLVMGPDCGTAVVGGVGLGFANTTEPGPVGLVAASGTGCQQLLALLDHAGVGVTDALGVGGRDLSSEVGGLSTREGMRRLDAEPDVELVVVVSKPPAPEVATAIGAYADSLTTPVQLALLGAGQPDLTAAAEAILVALGREVPQWPVDGPTARTATGHRLEGLFVGGTLCSESRLIAEPALGADRCRFVDYGDDEYTQGRAHPMIDPGLRLEELSRVGAHPATGVILLDVVLGHGAEPDPAAGLAPVLSALTVPVVASVVGTRLDPQDRARQVTALVEAGVEVHLSNAGATRRALELLAPDSDGATR
jgi:FdrA protein